MRSAVAVLFLVTVIAAEAPYHLPRPAPQAPSFNYPIQQAPAPLRYSTPQQNIPASQPSFIQNSGYQYQQPSIAPTFVQPISQPQIQQQTQFQPQPQPQPLPTYGLPQSQIAPRPQTPVESIRPLPEYLPPQPQLEPIRPLPSYITLQPQLESIRTLPAFVVSQQQPQNQPSAIYQPISYYQPHQLEIQQGYSYQQPQPQPLKYTSQLPLQSQPISNNVASQSLSSYQADSNLYSSAQPQAHGEGLDATVVDRVQNIIKENEHDSARNAGYHSLVSGVSLEGAKPSIEISSFVQNSPLSTSQSSELKSLPQSSSEQSSLGTASVSSPSTDYGLPRITANNRPSEIDSGIAFLPQRKPAISYGTPN